VEVSVSKFFFLKGDEPHKIEMFNPVNNRCLCGHVQFLNFFQIIDFLESAFGSRSVPGSFAECVVLGDFVWNFQFAKSGS